MAFEQYGAQYLDHETVEIRCIQTDAVSFCRQRGLCCDQNTKCFSVCDGRDLKAAV